MSNFSNTSGPMVSTLSALMGSEDQRESGVDKTVTSVGNTYRQHNKAQQSESTRRMTSWKYPKSTSSSASSQSSSSVPSSPEADTKDSFEDWHKPSLRPFTTSPTHKTTPSLPYEPFNSVGRPSTIASSFKAPAIASRKSPSSASAPSVLAVIFNQRRFFRWAYTAVFTGCLFVFFAALSGAGYVPPPQLNESEVLPFVTDGLASRHPSITVKHHEVFDHRRLATVVRPQEQYGTSDEMHEKEGEALVHEQQWIDYTMPLPQDAREEEPHDAVGGRELPQAYAQGFEGELSQQEAEAAEQFAVDAQAQHARDDALEDEIAALDDAAAAAMPIVEEEAASLATPADARDAQDEEDLEGERIAMEHRL